MGGNIDYLEEDLSPIATADLDVNKEPSFKKRQTLNFFYVAYIVLLYREYQFLQLVPWAI